MSSIFDRARGRWVEVLTSTEVGIPEKFLDGRHHPCPAGRKSTDTFRFKRDDDGGYFCCGKRANGLDLIMHVKACDYRTACELIETVVGKSDAPIESKQTASEKLAKSAQRLVRSRYLESRGLMVPPGLQCARALPYYESGMETGRYDAILAPVRVQGAFRAYHATYLLDGKKAPVSPARKILPGKPISGGAVELWPLEGDSLGVAEGVETAIAASMIANMPVWSTISAGGMESFVWPKSVKSLEIFADNDKSLTGQAAAWKLASRAAIAGLTVSIHLPENTGEDFNDVLQNQSGSTTVYTNKGERI